MSENFSGGARPQTNNTNEGETLYRDRSHLYLVEYSLHLEKNQTIPNNVETQHKQTYS